MRVCPPSPAWGYNSPKRKNACTKLSNAGKSGRYSLTNLGSWGLFGRARPAEINYGGRNEGTPRSFRKEPRIRCVVGALFGCRRKTPAGNGGHKEQCDQLVPEEEV